MNQRETEVLLQKSKRREYIFLALAILAIAGNVLHYALLPKIKLAKVEEYKLLNPARELHHPEDLIINVQPLRDYLNEKYEANPNVSIYFEFLNTGANIAISKD